MKISIGKRTVLAKTCTKCCRFKQANEFGRVQVVYLNSYCRRCHNGVSTPNMYYHQERSHQVAVRHRAAWTAADVQKLEEMVEKGLTGPQMSLALNRTLYAVYTMKNKLSKEKS